MWWRWSVSEKVISLDLIHPFQNPEDDKGLFLVTSVLVGKCIPPPPSSAEISKRDQSGSLPSTDTPSLLWHKAQNQPHHLVHRTRCILSQRSHVLSQATTVGTVTKVENWRLKVWGLRRNLLTSASLWWLNSVQSSNLLTCLQGRGGHLYPNPVSAPS